MAETMFSDTCTGYGGTTNTSQKKTKFEKIRLSNTYVKLCKNVYTKFHHQCLVRANSEQSAKKVRHPFSQELMNPEKNYFSDSYQCFDSLIKMVSSLQNLLQLSPRASL